MKHFLKVSIMLAMLALLVIPASLQDGAGEGGTIFLANTSGDPSSLIPFAGDGEASDVYGRLYPNVFGLNFFTGLMEPGAPGYLAESWEFDESGTVLTVNFRQDMTWNDGTPITVHDWIWSLDAIRSGVLDTQRGLETFESLDDGTPGSGTLSEVVALDDYTAQLTFARPDCIALNNVFDYVVPSHIFDADFGDDLAAMNDEPLYDPGVYANVWKDPNIVPGERVTLGADQTYTDGELGYVSPEELIFVILPDGDIAHERFLNGEITLMGIQGTKQDEISADPRFQTYNYERLGYVFYSFNLADPENPLPGVDEDGNIVEQDPHPVLADTKVRQAITMAVDMDAIIENNLGGKAIRVGIPSIPASFDWDPDFLYPFDPVRASELLDEAGWIDEDGNGVRECRGCAEAERDASYEGTEMSIMLNDSAGGAEEMVRMVEFIAQSMRDVGINTEVQYLDWGSAFLPELTGQTFDMAILAWGLGLPLDPDNSNIFGPEADAPGAGFNFVSYQNPELDQLYLDARDPAKTNGCDVEVRGEMYRQANEILFNDPPYLFMYANLRMTAAQAGLENWDPAPFNREWQEDAWVIRPAE